MLWATAQALCFVPRPFCSVLRIDCQGIFFACAFVFVWLCARTKSVQPVKQTVAAREFLSFHVVFVTSTVFPLSLSRSVSASASARSEAGTRPGIGFSRFGFCRRVRRSAPKSLGLQRLSSCFHFAQALPNLRSIFSIPPPVHLIFLAPTLCWSLISSVCAVREVLLPF
jgi:hypothetical protein